MRSVTKSPLPYRPASPFAGGLLLALGVSLIIHGALLAYPRPAQEGSARPPRESPPSPPPVQLTLKLPPEEKPPVAAAPPLFLPEPRQAERPAPAPAPVAPVLTRPHSARAAPPQPHPEPHPQSHPQHPPKPRPEVQPSASPQDRVERAVKAALVYPPEAIARGLQGVVLVRIFFDEGGKVIAARVDRSCGHAILDEAAKQAAQALTSLPGAPQEVTLPVAFRLH